MKYFLCVEVGYLKLSNWQKCSLVTMGENMHSVVFWRDLVDVVQNNLFPIYAEGEGERENRFGCTVVWYVLGAKPAPRIEEKHAHHQVQPSVYAACLPTNL
jgi:hypothetical protein